MIRDNADAAAAANTAKTAPASGWVAHDRVTGSIMTKHWVAKRQSKDEKGAALIEYTVLLGVLLVSVIATIGLVGNWINTKWSALICSCALRRLLVLLFRAQR